MVFDCEPSKKCIFLQNVVCDLDLCTHDLDGYVDLVMSNCTNFIKILPCIPEIGKNYTSRCLFDHNYVVSLRP